MARLGLETQGRLGTANGLPGRDRGTGTVLPTTDLRRGDAYFHTGQECLFVYTGAVWRQATIPTTDAATAPLHDGQYRDHPTLGLQRGAGGAWGSVEPTRIGPWVFPTLLNGYANFAGGWPPVRYRTEGPNLRINGAVGAGPASAIFQLPASLFPTYNQVVWGRRDSGEFGHFAEVQTGGAILPLKATATYFIFDGVVPLT